MTAKKVSAKDFLINNGKAVIVISHDRKFVDNITTRTIEVTMESSSFFYYLQYLLRSNSRHSSQAVTSLISL